MAADAAICRLINIAPDRLPTNRAAEKIDPESTTPHITGDFFTINDFKLPDMAKLSMGPNFLNRLTRRYVIQKPVVDKALCKLCGECRDYCPAKAISDNGEALLFNYEICIRCYCCIEICPHAALQAVETGPGRFVRKFFSLDS